MSPSRRMRPCHAALAAALWPIALLPFYTLFRAAFLWTNEHRFRATPLGELLRAFLAGLRFDLAGIVQTNVPFLLWLLAGSVFAVASGSRARRIWAGGIAPLGLLCNVPFLFFNLADIEYSKFSGTRLHVGVFSLWRDFLGQAPQLGMHFLQIPIAFAFCSAILYWMTQALAGRLRKAPAAPLPARLPQTLVSFALLVSFGRGGIGSKKPIGLVDAFNGRSGSLGQLALNASISLLHGGRSDGRVPGVSYFKSPQEARAVLGLRPEWDGEGGSLARRNVVVLILEGFGQEYLGAAPGSRCYAPFLRSLAERSLSFNRAYANGRQSIQAPFSVLAGLPPLMGSPIVNTPYVANDIHGMGALLRERGYQTAFFHGGRNGTMRFDAMTSLLGFSRYHGADEYLAQAGEAGIGDDDGTWGIFDGPFLRYAGRELGRMREPFAAGIFTLSSHNPFRLPAEASGRFPKGDLEIHESIGYADSALRDFFASIEREPWYERTLFVLTADHTAQSREAPYAGELGAHRVPLLFFSPGATLPAAETESVAQHADILPSVAHLLGLSRGLVPPFGRSLFEPGGVGRAIFFQPGTHTLAGDEGVVTLSDSGEISLFRYVDPMHLLLERDPSRPELRRRLGSELEALIQLFRNGANNDSWYR